ncbi:hypothetical protein R1sor_017430 [Riccia sorocarpa]|uniref:Enhancer of polycomb-like protein n=1 Tax=Riccia sorocarpa TaxID=122646 RepID=A0ABD3I6U0_9MARC
MEKGWGRKKMPREQDDERALNDDAGHGGQLLMVEGRFLKIIGQEGRRIQRQACGNCMEGKSGLPVMIPMSRSSRDYRASKTTKVSSEDTSSKKSQIRASGSPSRSVPATKKAKTGGLSTPLSQNRSSSHGIEAISARGDGPKQPGRSAPSKRAADANDDVTLDKLRPSKKSKITTHSLKNGEAGAGGDNVSPPISKSLKTEAFRKKQVSGNAVTSKTPSAPSSDNALKPQKLPKSGAASAGASSLSEETQVVRGSIQRISEAAPNNNNNNNAVGCSEPPEVTEQRSLRPRPKPPASKKVVKRTRFHEVSLDDSDGPRIVGRRIKVFWPLDKKWYYGSVKSYSGVKKQHKIIYDDHDEEWLKLQKESFRLEVLPGDSFGCAAPASDLANLADLVASTECTTDSGKHRGDVLDGSSSASDDKSAAVERTGARRSKTGKTNKRKRKIEDAGDDKKKKPDGTSEERRKAGRRAEKKKLDVVDSEPNKIRDGDGDGDGNRGKRSEGKRGPGKKRGDGKQRAKLDNKLGRGSGKRAILEVYERRKKKAQAVDAASGPSEREEKGTEGSDGGAERRKRTVRDTSRKDNGTEPGSRDSASDAAAASKKTSRRTIRDNDRLFASIKSPGAVSRRKSETDTKRPPIRRREHAENIREEVQSVSGEGEEEDGAKVFSRQRSAEARRGKSQDTEKEAAGNSGYASPVHSVSREDVGSGRDFDAEGSPLTSTVEVTEEDNPYGEASSPISVPETISADNASSKGEEEEKESPSDSSLWELNEALNHGLRGDVQEYGSDETMADVSKVVSSESVCLYQSSKEGVEQTTGDGSGIRASEAVESEFEILPSMLEDSSKQEVLRSAFSPVTIPTSEMKHPPDKVYVRARHKIHKVYRRETQSSQVQKKGVQDEGSVACAPVVEPVVQQLSPSSCVISALHVILDGPFYFRMGLEGIRDLSLLRNSGLGRWSNIGDDGTRQLGTYLGFPGVLSLLRVSRRMLHLFLTGTARSKTLVESSLYAVDQSQTAGSCEPVAFSRDLSEGNILAKVPTIRPGVLSPGTGRSGPLRRRRITFSFHPYLKDPLRESKHFSSLHHGQFVKKNGVNRSFRRHFVEGPRLNFEHANTHNLVPLTKSAQALPASLHREGQHLCLNQQILCGSSGAVVVSLPRRWFLPNPAVKHICSASLFFNMRRGSEPSASLAAALGSAFRERRMVKFPVASVSGETWDNPRGWGCREVGTYYGRRSLLCILKVSVGDLCVHCSFSSPSRNDGWQLAATLMVVREVYGFCKDYGFGVVHLSGRDCMDLIQGLIRKLLGDRAMVFHLARVWGWKLVTDLRKVADQYDHVSPGRRERRIGEELTQLSSSQFSHGLTPENSTSVTDSGIHVDVDETCRFRDLEDHRASPLNNPISLRLLQGSDRRRSNSGDISPSTSSNVHPPGAFGLHARIPRPLHSPAPSGSAVSCQLLPFASSCSRRAYARKETRCEGGILRGRMGSITQRTPSVLMVLDRASFAAANPVLMFSSSMRSVLALSSGTSMRRCTDVGTYFGTPSIESILRISKDFWKRIFQEPRGLDEEKSAAMGEAPVSGLFSQGPESSSVDIVHAEDLYDLEDRLQVISVEGLNSGGSSETNKSKECSAGEDVENGSAESVLPSAEESSAGNGLKRDFESFIGCDRDANNVGVGDANAAGAQCLMDNRVADKPLSKRTRADIEGSHPGVVGENGVEASSPPPETAVLPAAAEQKTDESALPRVNVLKLRRCPTNKGLWRVAGNSCTPPQERSSNAGRASDVRDSGDGAELMTPVLEMSGKRDLNHCSEVSHPDRNGQTSLLNSIYSSTLTDCSPGCVDQEMLGATTNKGFPLDPQPKEVWYDCGMTYVGDVPEGLELSRKRRRKGPSPPSHSDEVEAVSEHSLRRTTDSGCTRCIANVLITKSDRCVRETGAVIELQPGHGNTWTLSVTVNGESKYAYKADQPVATGTSNKFTHAMMWRGGKDWSLEFADRKQWHLFKDLHDECFQRTVRAATVRHIPIPGVKQIPELPRTGARFMRPYAKYIRQIDVEVESALTSPRVIYDMDSEDELWLNELVTSSDNEFEPRIEEDTLERVIDKLEKMSFLRSQQEPLLSYEEAAQVCHDLATPEVVKAIHVYWHDKRTRNGMALVRHFQPAPWEQYQKLLEDWQAKVNQLQQESPTANKQQLQSMCKRPPLFAFCLRPRGLENRNKTQRQRSQRKQGLGGSSSRPWTLAGPASDFFLDSPSKRLAHLETSSGSFYGSRKYSRQRLEESVSYAEPVPVDLTESFNALASGEGFTSSGGAGQVIPAGTFSQVDSCPPIQTERQQPTTRHYKKKPGRKARKMRLLASAEESRRKRQLRAHHGLVKEKFLDVVRSSPHTLAQFGDAVISTPSTSALSFPHTDGEDVDLEAIAIAKAAAAKLARETATAKRARAQALYAVADAAMHKAVAAVIAADAIHASERAIEEAAALAGKEERFSEQTAEVPVKDEGSRTRLRTSVTEGGTSFGSWRRALNSASRNANHLLTKGTSNSKQGLMPDTDDPLLPVASWSQELGAGLGTRLIQTGEVSPQSQRYSPVVDGRSRSPAQGVANLGQTRGETTLAMLTR